jgi:hypothetical protein
LAGLLRARPFTPEPQQFETDLSYSVNPDLSRKNLLSKHLGFPMNCGKCTGLVLG